MSNQDRDNQVVRQADGRFVKPPKSPGRPVGPSRAERIATFLEPHLEETLTKLAELAKLGDPRSAELLLKYLAPVARPEDERVNVPGFANAPSLEGKSAAVMAAIANGEVSATAGQRLLQALETHVRIVSAHELEQRVQALEGKNVTRTTVIDAGSGDVSDADFEDLA